MDLGLGITNSCTQLHPVPSTSTQLISTSTQLYPSLPSSLQHAQQYLNQNIANNLEIFILEMLIPNPTPRSIFGKIWNQKFKVVHFVWKLVHMVSQGCWFQIQTEILEILTQNSFLGKFGSKNSKLSVLCKNW